MQARSTYFVGATLDATFIKNIVDYFCGVKSVTALGAQPARATSNRTATITLCEGPLGRHHR
jgi:hypothetical protein